MFNEVCELCGPLCHGPGPWTMDLFHEFSNKKIILKIPAREIQHLSP
jgi:hypothetical protein